MKGQISTTKVGDKTYSQIFSENGIAYASKTAAQKKQLRKIFLYGMASHIVTDAFAHSAYCRCGSGGTYVKVSDKHNDDDPGVHTKRFYDCDELAKSRERLNFEKKGVKFMIDAAETCLRDAKITHDRLERFYISAANFEKLDDIYKKLISEF